ncbi:MAG: D-aminoacylase [Tepidisphaeraceae bacterium]
MRALPRLLLACILLFACAPSLAAPATRPAFEADHELVIRNGKIIDGTGNGWFYGDVLIKGTKIAAVGKVDAGPKAEVIDALGLIVAPGFIDVHTHADNGAIGSLGENFIRDGVTTIVAGNCGGSTTDVASYFSRLRMKGSALNVATLIGHNSVRREAKDDSAGDMTPEQMEKAKELVRQAMRDGAVGLSTGLIYRPGLYSKTEEIIELAKVVGEFGGIYATHMRSEGTNILAAIDEALRIGREGNCRVEISHFKLPRDIAKSIGGAGATLGRVIAARAGGQEVWIDQYPYTASSTGINTLLPDWVYDQGSDEAKKRLEDPEQVKKMLADMKQNYEVERKRASLGYAVIASSSAEPNLAGRNLYEVTQVFKMRKEKNGAVELLAEKPEKMPAVTMDEQYLAVIDICRRGGASMVFHTMDEEEVEDILRHPLVSVASDSGIREIGSGVPHPRGYGTNSRVLGRYVRERQIITLEDAVRKMTSQPALAFRFDDRGLIRPGYVADLVLFDAAKVIDQATFEKPHQFPLGIPHVIVNGYSVLRDGEMTGLLPGKPVPGPGGRDEARAPETQPAAAGR